MRARGQERQGEQGFVLVGMIVAIFLILLVLSIAAPKVARGLRREREVESEHRAQQYTRAIRIYYQKLGHYPGSIEQLEKTNNIRFLRQRYTDPLTGKADWRLIHQGEAKTTVKGLFGQPLGGLATSGLGSAAGNASAGGVGSTVGGSGSSSSGSSGFGSSSGGLGSSPGASSGTSGFGSSSFGSSGGSSGTSGSGASSGSGSTVSSSSSGSLGSGISNGFGSTGGPIMGIGSSASGESIVVVNEQTTYPTWEFLYDPRIEALSKGVNLFGGGVASTGAGGLGSASGLSSGIGTGSTGTSPAAAGAGASGGGSSTGNPGASPTGTSSTPVPDNDPPGSGLPPGAQPQ